MQTYFQIGTSYSDSEKLSCKDNKKRAESPFFEQACMFLTNY